MSDRDAIRAMKNSHPIGIPHSIFFENIWARTFDSTKLEEDKERLREAYRDKGYFTAKVLDQDVKIREGAGRANSRSRCSIRTSRRSSPI